MKGASRGGLRPAPGEAEDDVWALTERERRAWASSRCPKSLSEAIAARRASELLAETLGEHVFDFFLRNKRAEWESTGARSRSSSATACCRWSDDGGDLVSAMPGRPFCGRPRPRHRRLLLVTVLAVLPRSRRCWGGYRVYG